MRIAGAPFSLQPDAFSCRDALNFNRPAMGIANSGALFENPVNAQGENSPCFRLLFAVAKMSNPPYCVGSVGERNNLGNWTTSINRDISIAQPDSTHGDREAVSSRSRQESFAPEGMASRVVPPVGFARSSSQIRRS
jgi:hypothetical protein